MAVSILAGRAPVFRSFVVLVSIVAPLTASALMGSRFLSELGTGTDSRVLLLGAGALLASSAVLGTLAGRCYRAGSAALALLCMFAWLVIVAISTGSSTLSLLNTSGSVISKQINYSQQGRAVQQSINANLATIKSLQQQIDAADPVRWRTRRAEWSEQIRGLQRDNARLFNRQDMQQATGAGSSVAGSFARVGALFGVSGKTVILVVALLFSVALDLLPFTAGAALGFIYGTEPAKKPLATAPKLRAVA